MIKVNVSSIQSFMACRFRWWCEWVMNRTPRNTSPALTGGKIIHEIFEGHFQNGEALQTAANMAVTKYKRLLPALTDAELKNAEESIKIITDLDEAWPLWQDKFPFEKMLECEKPFEIVIPWLAKDITWLGRPDYIGVCLGRIWHRQNRGLAAGMNFGTYLALAKRHYHEHLYAEYAAEEYKHLGLRYGGTVWNLVRKLKFRTNVGKKNEQTKTAEEMFFSQASPVNLKSPLHKAVMMAARDHVYEMDRVRREWDQESKIPPPNEKMNGGYGGNALDPYFLVLTGEIKLSDDKWFKDREDMYEEKVGKK